MNIVLSADSTSYAPSHHAHGTNEARADNAIKPAIEPVQSSSQAAQSKQQNTGQQTSKDKVSLSAEGKQALKQASQNDLSEEEQDKVEALKNRDTQVRVHEQAHAAVGGQYAGSPSYEYESGPDGQRYAVGGEVPIDVGTENTPEETIQKMQVVRAAALAPAQPSSQDLKVAAQASQQEQQARVELGEQKLQEDKAADTEEPSHASNAKETASPSINKHQAKLAQEYNDLNAQRALASFSTTA